MSTSIACYYQHQQGQVAIPTRGTRLSLRTPHVLCTLPGPIDPVVRAKNFSPLHPDGIFDHGQDVTLPGRLHHGVVVGVEGTVFLKMLNELA
ncbi:MAG: hypothetical protein MUO31_09030 [Thermodesulfovibrionales bacterium]|nr:hypothetical protein [Thermodesulfovibrionales bacterium]